MLTWWDDLVDLVLPGSCAVCGEPGREVCAGCAAAIERLRPGPARPTPAPEGLPECFAYGEYAGGLRELILAYKERGRHRLARPLGALLAEAVAEAVPQARPLLLLYVPDTAQAARERLGDHMLGLARHAAMRLDRVGYRVEVRSALRALPKIDSTQLDAESRAAAARGAFAPRRWGLAHTRSAAARRAVVLVDDIITTGVTLAAAAVGLEHSGVPVDACATLAATRLRRMV